MTIAEIEKGGLGRRTGALKPSAELRKSLEEAEKCREYFEREGFIEYLQSVNEVYLGNQGNIVGPRLEITSETEEENRTSDQEFLEMVNPSGGVGASLEWDNDEDGEPKKEIVITLGYSTLNDLYTVSLFSGARQRQKGENNSPINKGRSLQRNFYLNPIPGMSKRIDDLLLTFTEELLESKIL